jgi:outer membrane protein OmpA-like peptidoglycan-associated protein
VRRVGIAVLRGCAGLLLGAAFTRVAAAQGAGAGTSEPSPRIPLRAGLTVVTAISQPTGDYESIKRIVALTPDTVHLTYSNEHPKPLGLLEDPSPGPRPLVKLNTTRTIVRRDLGESHSYLQQFGEPRNVPDLVPGTTAVGVSAAVLQELKTQGSTQLTVYQASVGGMPPIVEPREPGTVDYRLTGTLSRVEPQAVPVPVIVNGTRVELPAVHAKGTLVYPAEFWFLDDPENPLALRYMIDRDTLTVIAIDFPGEAPGGPEAQQAGGAGAGEPIGAALSKVCRAEIHGIYFDFNEATLRPESDATLKEIAEALRRNPPWTIRIEGHTDSIGGAKSNLALSQRRADAVKQALVTRYTIDTGRLSTQGFGASRPKESNATLEGRARNRRVELVRACANQ